MYKSKHIIGKRNGKIHRFALFFTVLMLLCGVLLLFPFTPSHVSADKDSSVKKLQNGSFEEGQTWTGTYQQPDQSQVPGWNTTAFQGLIELFKENKNTYISGVTLKPSDGTYAAELNADEESTLYQNVKTVPSSVYEWGLDHGARNGTDTMALVIGPKQSVNPSKPSKAGRDQLMQMVDWLIAQGLTSNKTSAGLGEQRTVYSKKFAAGGTFEDNAGNNPFSLTPSAIYTEEWHIWIMASSKATSGTNPWNSYGSNAESSAGSSSVSSQAVDLSKYYLYTVPSGQTETLFGFVSVGYYQSSTTADKAKTYGNFLDNINFEIYHPLSGSTTTHGSAVVGGSDGTTGGTGSSDGHHVTIDNKLATYVVDGEPLKIQAIVKKADAYDGCEFVGVYHTEQDENGNPVTKFLRLDGNEIEDTGSLTDEEKAGKWVKSTNEYGDTIYNYYLDNLTSATDLHFVFLKSPTVTYDPNGGKPYVVKREHNTDEAANVYSFKPASGAAEAEAGTKTLFIDPYVSHAAEGQNDGWKFMGWRLIGDVVDGDLTGFAQVNADKLGSLILPAEHTIACDYTFDGVDGDTKAQYFKIYDGNVPLTKQIVKDENSKDVGVTWIDNRETKAYANVHKGLTMVAQWRWLQAFIPQVYNVTGNSYSDSAEGGTVEITSVTDTSDKNYNVAYNENGGKSYHAATGERVNLTATAKKGYGFVGWYDERGKLVATNAEYSYVETQESVKTYYARFKESVTQTYIRQVGSGDSWEDTIDDKIGTLGRYTYTDAVGMPISSTATAGSGYKFMGWYDSEGNKVADNMLINDGATISYTTTGNATYYARFSNSVTQTFIRQVKNGDSWKVITDDTIGTLGCYTYTDAVGMPISSTATAGSGYKFMGWYDSEGNKVANNMLINDGATISYTTTGDATYYARFSNSVTQTYIRQVKNGDSWIDTTDDKIGTLTKYEDVGEIDKPVSSKATAGSGYRFVGWYDSEGNDANKVSNDMLTDNGMTISYTTTGNATYYARFEKVYTLNVSKIDGDQSTDGNKVPLAGAEFTLYQADENGEQTIVYKGASIKCTAVRTSVTALNAEGTQATAVFTNTLSPDSVYYLAETKAPTGYRLLDAPLKINFDDSGNSALIDGIKKDITEHEVNVELANYLTLHMPISGTPFTGGLFAVTGLSLLTLAAIGLFWFKISRYKSKNK